MKPYDVFISYSHAADDRLAPSLQSAIKRLGRSWTGRSNTRVFRDKSSLSASPQLWPAIEKSLRNSNYFLLLASPASAKSEWVRKEIECWLEDDKSAQRLLIALTEGTITWADDQRDFDWETTDALSETILRGKFQNEPLYVDLTGAKGADKLSLSHPEFADNIASLSSAIRGIPKEDVIGQDVRQRKRFRIYTSVAFGALLVLAIFAGVSAYQANEQRINALAGGLSAQSALMFREQPSQIELAVLLAIESQRLAPSRQGYRALKSTLDVMPDLVSDLQGFTQPLTAHFSPNGSYLAAGSETGEITVWDTNNWERVFSEVISEGQPIYAVRFDADGKRLAASDKEGRICLWDVAGGARGQCLSNPSGARMLEFLPGDSRLLAGSGEPVHRETKDPCLRIWDLEKEVAVSICHDDVIVGAFSIADGARILTGSKDGSVRIWDAASGRELRRLRATSAEGVDDVMAMSLSRDRRMVAVAWWTAITVWDTDQFNTLFEEENSSANVSVALMANDDDDSKRFLLAGKADGSVNIWRFDTHECKVVSLPFNTTKVATNPNQDWFAAATDQQVIELYQYPNLPTLRARLPVNKTGLVSVLEFDPSGKYLLAGVEQGQLRVWRSWKTNPYAVIETPGDLKQFSLQVNDTLAVTASSDTAIVWDYSEEPPREVARYTHSTAVDVVGISPDGKWVVTAGSSKESGPAAEARLWNRARRDLERVMLLRANPISAAFDAGGGRLAIAQSDLTVQVWATEADRLLTEFRHSTPIKDLTFSPDDRYLVIQAPSKPLFVFDTKDWEKPPMAIGGDEKEITSFVFHPDGELIMGATLSGTKTWGVEDGKMVHNIGDSIVWSVDV